MDRRSALVLLAVFGTGVFLSGLELMITAVALPSILADLADPSGTACRAPQGVAGSSTATCWSTSSRCRWPAGWPTCGARAGCSWPRWRFTSARCWPGVPQSLDQLIAARLVQARRAAASWCRSRRPPPSHLFDGRGRGRARSASSAALTFLGMAAGPFVGRRRSSARSTPETRSPRPADRDAARRPSRAGLALGLLPQRPDRADRPARRLGGCGGLGHAAAAPAGIDLPGAACSALALSPGSSGSRFIGTTEFGGSAVDPAWSPSSCSAPPSCSRSLRSCAALRVGDPFLDPRLFRDRRVLVGRARLAADRLRVRDGDHRRRRLRRPRPLRRAGRAAARARRARRRDRRRGARLGLRGPRPARSALVTLSGWR